jgi:hypothetical protein
MQLFIDPTVGIDSISDVAESLGMELYNCQYKGRIVRISARPIRHEGKDRYSFVLRPSGERFRRYNRDPYAKSGERKAWAVCWHGHWHFMREIFRLDRNACFVTSRIGKFNYGGLDEFLENADASGDANVGSQIYPQYMRDACHCEGRDADTDE